MYLGFSGSFLASAYSSCSWEVSDKPYKNKRGVYANERCVPEDVVQVYPSSKKGDSQKVKLLL